MSALGLIEMTRKRVRESAVTGLVEPCFYCEGRGHLASLDVLIDGVLSRIRQLASTSESTEVTVRANPRLIERLTDECRLTLAQIEADRSITISLCSNPDMHLEHVEVN